MTRFKSASKPRGRAITLNQAKKLRHGQVIYDRQSCNADGTAVRWRVSGKPKTWVRSPGRVKVPIKYGMYVSEYLTENDLHHFTLKEPPKMKKRNPASAYDGSLVDRLVKRSGIIERSGRASAATGKKKWQQDSGRSDLFFYRGDLGNGTVYRDESTWGDGLWVGSYMGRSRPSFPSAKAAKSWVAAQERKAKGSSKGKRRNPRGDALADFWTFDDDGDVEEYPEVKPVATYKAGMWWGGPVTIQVWPVSGSKTGYALVVVDARGVWMTAVGARGYDTAAKAEAAGKKIAQRLRGGDASPLYSKRNPRRAPSASTHYRGPGGQYRARVNPCNTKRSNPRGKANVYHYSVTGPQGGRYLTSTMAEARKLTKNGGTIRKLKKPRKG